MNLPFILPPINSGEINPSWDGNGFRIGDKITNVLQYSINHLGWNDDLTFFHEESAGEHHFIDRASRDYTIQQLKQNIKIEHPILLEIGCSSGFMLRRLKDSFPTATIIGSDVVTEPLQKLAESMPKTPLFRFDLTHCPLPDNTIDAVVILNVLEHIENDNAALKQIHRILKPGGIMVLEVPAGPHLFDVYDKILMHFRRYKLSDLAKTLGRHHFKILKKSHLGFFIYPGFQFVKKRNKKHLKNPIHEQTELVKNDISKTANNSLLHLLMKTELAIGKFISYPLGIRCLVTCVKD